MHEGRGLGLRGGSKGVLEVLILLALCRFGSLGTGRGNGGEGRVGSLDSCCMVLDEINTLRVQ